MSIALALRIQAHGASQASGEVRRFAGSMDVVSSSSQRAQQNLKGTADAAQLVGVQARAARAMQQEVAGVGEAAGLTERNVRALANSASEGFREGESRAKAFGSAVLGAAKDGAQAWTGMKFSVDGVIGKLKEAEDRLDGFRKKAGMGLMAGGVAGTLAMGSTAPAAGQMQMWEIAFSKMLGSPEAGREKIAELSEFAANTPFDMEGSVNQAQSLTAMGFKADEIIPVLGTLGDAMAGLGKGADVMDRVVYNLGQVRTQGNATAADLRQFNMAGINVREAMKAGTGKEYSNDELTAMDGEEFIKNFMAGLRKQFGGMMAEQSKTFPGAMNKLGDAFFRLRVAMGQPLVNTITMVTNGIGDVINWFAKLPEPMRYVISWTVAIVSGLGFLVGALITLAPTIGAVLIAIKVLGFASNLTGISLGRLAWTMTSRLLPAIAGQLIPGIGNLAGGITGKLLPALIGSGGLASVLSVALPLAIATGVALMIKSAMEARMAFDEERRNDAEPGDESKMAPKGTREGALARAEDMERQAKEVEEKAAQAREQAHRARFSVKIFGYGDTAADFNQEAEGHEARQKMLLTQAAKLRAGASSLPSASVLKPNAAIPAASGVNPIDGVTSSTVAGISFAGGGEVASLESEIENLQRAMRTADKDEKKVLSDQLFEKRLALKHARAAAAAEKKSTSAAERDAKKAQRESEKAEKDSLKASIEDDQLEYDVKATEAEEGFNTRIAELEVRRDAAREAKDEAKEAALEFEIKKLEIERNYQLAKMQADSTGLEDEKKRDAQMRIAEAKKRGALTRAQMAFNSAKNKGLDAGALRTGGVLPGLPRGLQTIAAEQFGRLNGGMAGMRSGDYGDGGPMTRMIDAPQRPANMNSLAANIGAKAKDWVAKATGKQEKMANGKLRIVFDDVVTEDPAAAMGGRI